MSLTNAIVMTCGMAWTCLKFEELGHTLSRFALLRVLFSQLFFSNVGIAIYSNGNSPGFEMTGKRARTFATPFFPRTP